MAKGPDDKTPPKKPPHLTVVPKAPKERASKEPTQIVIKGHETFQHAGMTATMIDGQIHFLDRSYADSIGRIGYNIHYTIEENSLELQAFGTLKLVSGVFAIGGNGAEIPIKAYWLNADQLMILTMQSRTPKGVAFRKVLVDLIKALREGRLVYADGAMIEAQPKPAAVKAIPAHRRPLICQSELGPRDQVSPQLRSILKIEDEGTADRMLHDARMEKIAPSLEAFLTDETGQLRMRYSTLATILKRDLNEVYYKCVADYGHIARIAPLWTREELYGHFSYAPNDLGRHEAPYLTLAQAVAIAVDMRAGHLEDEIVEAFRRYMRVLSGYAEETARHAAQRAEWEAKLVNAPTVLGLLKRVSDGQDHLAAQIHEQSSRLSAVEAAIASTAERKRAPGRGWRFWRTG